MMMRRAKFRRGHPSQCRHPKFKTFKLSHHSHTLSLVNHSVSESLFRLLLVPAVHSPPNCRALLIYLPTVHHYFWLQCHAELLHHRLLVPHPTVGPIPPMEHKVTMKMILSWLPRDGFCNSRGLQLLKVILQALLHIILVSMPLLVSAHLVSLLKINSQLVTMMTACPPPHNLWEYVELGPPLGSLQPYLTPTPCLLEMMTVE